MNKIYIKILNFIITSIKKIVPCTKLVYYVVKVLNNIMEVRKQRYHLYFLGHGGVVSPNCFSWTWWPQFSKCYVVLYSCSLMNLVIVEHSHSCFMFDSSSPTIWTVLPELDTSKSPPSVGLFHLSFVQTPHRFFLEERQYK